MAVQTLLIIRSKEAAVHRFYEGGPGHRKGIGWCVSSSQVMSGRHQRDRQALRCTFESNDIPLLRWWTLSQEIQDVKDKLEDLIPWVVKLEDTLTKASTKDRGEVERRTQLEKFALHLYYPDILNWSSIGPWVTLKSSLKCCWRKGGRVGSSRRPAMLKQLSDLLISFRKQFSSTKWVLSACRF